MYSTSLAIAFPLKYQTITCYTHSNSGKPMPWRSTHMQELSHGR
ncbi:MAG: hypothetical protein OYH77_01300 [Pseudomonadota bacterium]|nr:hypothetical protein [Pseudomonadota bacterium]